MEAPPPGTAGASPAAGPMPPPRPGSPCPSRGSRCAVQPWAAPGHREPRSLLWKETSLALHPSPAGPALGSLQTPGHPASWLLAAYSVPGHVRWRSRRGHGDGDSATVPQQGLARQGPAPSLLQAGGRESPEGPGRRLCVTQVARAVPHGRCVLRLPVAVVTPSPVSQLPRKLSTRSPAEEAASAPSVVTAAQK